MQPVPNDFIVALQRQRDNAMNALVNAEAEIAALKREIEELKKGRAEADAN